MNLLLQHEAKVSKTDIVGRNALSWACLYGYDQDVSKLLQNADVDLDLNQGDMYGQTALFHAATSGSAATVKIMVDSLKKYSLSCDIANFSGITPLMQASKLGHDVCASILIHQGGATVGINLQASEKVANEETGDKWATAIPSKFHRDHPYYQKANKKNETSETPKHRGPRFPPIISQSAAQKIKYRENRAGQLRICTPVNSDDDSTYGSEVSYYTDESFDQINLDSQSIQSISTTARSSPKLSIRSLSRSSSTEVNFNPSDAEIQKNFLEAYRNQTASFLDLPTLYHIYEEQNTRSYVAPRPRENLVLPKIDSSSDVSAESDNGLDTNRKKSGKE